LGEKQMTEGLQTVFGGAGVTCLVAAVIGGNVKVAGSELPIVNSPMARILLAIFGYVFNRGDTLAESPTNEDVFGATTDFKYELGGRLNKQPYR